MVILLPSTLRVFPRSGSIQHLFTAEQSNEKQEPSLTSRPSLKHSKMLRHAQGAREREINVDKLSASKSQVFDTKINQKAHH